MNTSANDGTADSILSAPSASSIMNQSSASASNSSAPKTCALCQQRRTLLPVTPTDVAVMSGGVVHFRLRQKDAENSTSAEDGVHDAPAVGFQRAASISICQVLECNGLFLAGALASVSESRLQRSMLPFSPHKSTEYRSRRKVQNRTQSKTLMFCRPMLPFHRLPCSDVLPPLYTGPSALWCAEACCFIYWLILILVT